jgi:hypothetical protein
MEAEIGEMQLLAREHLSHQKLEKVKKDSFSDLQWFCLGFFYLMMVQKHTHTTSLFLTVNTVFSK